MKRSKQLLGAVSSTALIAFSASPALAAGTTAGNSITNNVTVTFDVGGVTQNEVVDSDTFVVDRAIDVVVDFAGTGNTSVSPGESGVQLAFDVTNSSNDVLDFNLAAALNAGVSGNIGNFEIYLDSDGDRTLSAAELAAGPITSLDNVTADETVEVIVIADIGLGAGDGDTFDVVLTATALDSDGSALTQNTGANTAGEDTVFIDGAGTTDGNRDAAFSDVGTYEVAGAQMSVAKSSSIISDPVNGTTNPKAIPGATIEYCIVVSNAAGAATATDVDVNDVLPADVSYLSSFGIYVDGDGSCASGSRGDTGATPTASYNSTDHEIDADLSDVVASGQRSVYFRVTID